MVLEFSAKLEIIGINPFVLVPEAIGSIKYEVSIMPASNGIMKFRYNANGVKL